MISSTVSHATPFLTILVYVEVAKTQTGYYSLQPARHPTTDYYEEHLPQTIGLYTLNSKDLGRCAYGLAQTKAPSLPLKNHLAITDWSPPEYCCCHRRRR